MWSRVIASLERPSIGKLMWSKFISFGGARVCFQLKAKYDLLRVHITFEPPNPTVGLQMRLEDIRKVDAALLAMKSLLGSPLLDELARAREADLARLRYAVARIWRTLTDPYLWKQDVCVVGWGLISFRFKRDKTAYVNFEYGEEAVILPVRLRDLEALEEGLLASAAAMQEIQRACVMPAA